MRRDGKDQRYVGGSSSYTLATEQVRFRLRVLYYFVEVYAVYKKNNGVMGSNVN